MAPIYLSGVGGVGGWLYSDYNASLSSNWNELDWTGTELGNKDGGGHLEKKVDLNQKKNLEDFIFLYVTLNDSV